MYNGDDPSLVFFVELVVLIAGAAISLQEQKVIRWELLQYLEFVTLTIACHSIDTGKKRNKKPVTRFIRIVNIP
jgi:hypothetical protein